MTPITRSRFRPRYPSSSFAPGLLFLAGEQGAWYDPSDLSTLFQDAAGATPVTAVEQPVRLMRDKSGRGNNATAPSDAARPVLRARYNSLTYSEELTNAAYTTVRASIASSTAVSAPIGVSSLFKLTEDSSASNTHIFLSSANTPVISGTRYITTIYARAAERSWFALQEGQGVTATAYFNLATGNVGTVSGTGSPTASIEDIGNGWYRCYLNWTAVGAAARIRVFLATGDNAVVYTGNGTSGIYLTGTQIVSSVDNTSIGGKYQRIAAATDYNTVGFLPYLAYDGTNSSMSTSAIDFTATNKMSVFAGLTKLSDAAQAVVAEISATIASNNGSFLLTAPNSAAANYNFSSKGTTQVDNTVTTYTAPITNVVTGLADIGAPSNIIRVNGVQAGSSASSQGTGNFGNYALFIGGRNNASLRLNGRLYGLIVRGAASSAAQITSTERWMADKTGVTI
jgi:hypothetical protein